MVGTNFCQVIRTTKGIANAFYIRTYNYNVFVRNISYKMFQLCFQ